jgi:hypothetical protein
VCLLRANVLVIALAGFVVEPEHAYAVNDKGQAVFELVAAPRRASRQLPDHDIGKPALTDNPSFAKQEPHPHVGVYTNKLALVKAGECGRIAEGG